STAPGRAAARMAPALPGSLAAAEPTAAACRLAPRPGSSARRRGAPLPARPAAIRAPLLMRPAGAANRRWARSADEATMRKRNARAAFAARGPLLALALLSCGGPSANAPVGGIGHWAPL